MSERDCAHRAAFGMRSQVGPPPAKNDGSSPARLTELAHSYGGIRYAVGESPFVVVPGEHTHQPAVHDLRLREVEGGRIGVVVEVDRDERFFGHAQDALEVLLGRMLHRLVDLIHGRLAPWNDLE